MPTPVIAIFDIGKTNKKLFLFNDDYQIVFEASAQFHETKDDDGFPCEDIQALSRWVLQSLEEICSRPDYVLKAVNFSAHGASLALLDDDGNIAAPLYDYLKPFPQELKQKFHADYDLNKVCLETASPDLGNLNSGLHLYALKYEKPALFRRIKSVLHLPEYFSFLVAGAKGSTLPSIGCHTLLWDFQKNEYHGWVKHEGLDKLFAPIVDCNATVKVPMHGQQVVVGAGMHDSSAALVPYLRKIKEPFVLISTGTWSISLNPFNHSPLTREELEQDCLCYLSYAGKPVKATRYLIGPEHDRQTKRIAEHFSVMQDFFKTLEFNKTFLGPLLDFSTAELAQFVSPEAAYHSMMQYLVNKQAASTRLALRNTTVKKICVDGGFSTNAIYMNLLTRSLEGNEVTAATVPQASALGAALVMH